MSLESSDTSIMCLVNLCRIFSYLHCRMCCRIHLNIVGRTRVDWIFNAGFGTFSHGTSFFLPLFLLLSLPCHSSPPLICSYVWTHSTLTILYRYVYFMPPYLPADFLTTESGLSEFTHPECSLMLDLINEFASYVNGTWGREAGIKVSTWFQS